MRRPSDLRGEIAVSRQADRIVIDADAYSASIMTRGYVSGVAAGSFVDKRSGAKDLGFGLDIVDFLLEPTEAGGAIPKDQYEYGPMNAVHGNIPKRYVEGPQICTQAKHLEPTIHRSAEFVAIKQRYMWNIAYAPREKAGSVWEQTLIFPAKGRHFLSSDRVTVASASPAMTLRVDLPGHVKHREGQGFEHIYLSYNDPAIIPSTEFLADFPPDGRYLYTRGDRPPKRMIRAYQADLGPEKGDGPWLAGMTLNAADVSQAWCHQRGYVCMIEEIGGRPVKPGDTFGAAYVIGWFDDIEAMNATYDRYAGISGLSLDGPDDKPTGYRGLKASELTAIES